jgi:hypothetical protein
MGDKRPLQYGWEETGGQKLKRLTQEALRFGVDPPAEPSPKASISSILNH